MFRKVNLSLHCLSMSVNSFRPPPACHQMMSRGFLIVTGLWITRQTFSIASFRIATKARIMAIFTCMAVPLRKTLFYSELFIGEYFFVV